MTNPNPSPELRELIDMLEAATLEDGVRVYEHDAEEIGIATMNARADLLAALSPQTLPAPGEVDHIADAGKMIEVERIRRAIWGYVNAQPEDAATLPVVQFLANRDVFLAEAIATVAAANDEGMAKAIKALKPLADVYLTGSEPDDECVIDASDFPNAGHVRAARAAIRLLSQGGGKA